MFQFHSKTIPNSPGIYLFYDVHRELIYVGKATNLRARVRSYFRGTKMTRPIEQLIHEVDKIKWKETDSVLEAIILEAEYIKKYQPKYNVDGKDDKSWNYLAITNEPYPRIIPIRKHELDSKMQNEATASRHGPAQGRKFRMRNSFLYLFGPYPGLNAAAMMKLLRQLFLFSSCKPGQGRPCLYYQIGQCLGVCTGGITQAEYKKRVIQPLVMFLRGGKRRLIQNLEFKMKHEAKKENFEEAARLRNQVASLQRIQDVALLNKSFLEDNLKSITYNLEPKRIEGYDISNLGPTGVVGSMVVFTHGEPDKSQYRKFRIKSFSGQNDVDALAEVLTRRLRHEDWPAPDVILVDGGVPQVNKAITVLTSANVTIPVVGIAKGPARKKNDIILGSKNRDFIRWVSANTSLLIRVRDEAHRFAIAYQRQTRKLR